MCILPEVKNFMYLMSGNPVFDDVHSILQHKFIFGEMINEQCDKLIGKSDL